MFQPWLFEDLPSEPRPRRFQIFPLPGPFLRLRLAYEDLLFCALALLLVVLGGFCLGVERGKQLVPQPALVGIQGMATAGEEAPSRASARKRPPPVIPVGVTPVPVAGANGSGTTVLGPAARAGPYVLQLASYTAERVAQEEVRRLGKQGVQAQVIRQGRYFELRAIGFRSREEAKEALTGLRRIYRDAFLKRVGSG